MNKEKTRILIDTWLEIKHRFVYYLNEFVSNLHNIKSQYDLYKKNHLIG